MLKYLYTHYSFLDDPLCGDIERLRWELHGVGLDRGPWGVGEANELTLRPNPANRNAAIYKYHQVPLAGKRFSPPLVNTTMLYS